MKLDAILWDYDGTLVNSVPKNIDITKAILSIVAPHLTGDNLPKYLHSEANYHYANHAAKNWQELYVDYYGMSHDEMLKAGGLWAEHQEKNQTPVTLFEGIDGVIKEFAQLPHGICSQNSQSIFVECCPTTASARRLNPSSGMMTSRTGIKSPMRTVASNALSRFLVTQKIDS